MNPTLSPEPSVTPTHTEDVTTSTPTTSSQFTKGVEPFKDWICPISLTLMTTPMVAADGYTYEKTAIEQWLQTHTTSPMDRSPIIDQRLYKNTALAIAIQAWKHLNPDVVRKDQELDRQLEITAMRTKPTPVSVPVPQPRSYISQVAQISFTSWQGIQDYLSFDNTPEPSPRYRQPPARVVPVVTLPVVSPRYPMFSVSSHVSPAVVPM